MICNQTTANTNFLYGPNLNAQDINVEILKSIETKRKLVLSYGMNATKINHTHRTPGTIPRGYPKPIPSRIPDTQSYTKPIPSPRLDTQTVSTKIWQITSTCNKQIEKLLVIPRFKQLYKIPRNNMYWPKSSLRRAMNFPHMSQIIFLQLYT